MSGMAGLRMRMGTGWESMGGKRSLRVCWDDVGFRVDSEVRDVVSASSRVMILERTEPNFFLLESISANPVGNRDRRQTASISIL